MPPSFAPIASAETIRTRQTASSGKIAMTSTSGSAASAQPSSTATSSGTYHLRPSRSRTSQVSMTGSAVPMWPTEKITTKMPTPGCGASMMPSTSAILATPAQPRALPLASSMATATTSV